MTETPKNRTVENAFSIIQNAAAQQETAYSRTLATVVLLEYGTEYLSTFGLGLCGLSVRLTREDSLLTVKVIESGIPLVAFVTSRTPTGSIERYLDMLESGRLQWHKDKYPWI